MTRTRVLAILLLAYTVVLAGCIPDKGIVRHKRHDCHAVRMGDGVDEHGQRDFVYRKKCTYELWIESTDGEPAHFDNGWREVSKHAYRRCAIGTRFPNCIRGGYR